MDGKDLDVSRETFEALQDFVALVQKWTTKINLISRLTVEEIWERHVMDSAQIHVPAPPGGTWVDLGSGGGFPGIIAAILSKGAAMPHDFHLIESDHRKAVFLRTAARELGLRVTVHANRIDEMTSLQADILSARALADLDRLLGFANHHLHPDGIALFPKGGQWKKEDAAARLQWSYSCEVITSKTNPAAAILKIKDISRV